MRSARPCRHGPALCNRPSVVKSLTTLWLCGADMAKVTGYFPTSAQPKLLPWRERKEQIRVIYTEFAVTRCDERRRLRKDLRKIMARYISARVTWDVTPEKA